MPAREPLLAQQPKCDTNCQVHLGTTEQKTWVDSGLECYMAQFSRGRYINLNGGIHFDTMTLKAETTYVKLPMHYRYLNCTIIKPLTSVIVWVEVYLPLTLALAGSIHLGTYTPL